MTTSDDRDWRAEIPPILGEALLCAAFMALPFLLLGGTLASMISAGIALFWHGIAGLVLRRIRGDAPEAGPEAEETVPRFLSVAQFAVFGLVALAYVVTARWLYAPESIPEDLKSILHPGFEIPAGLFLLAGVLFVYKMYKSRRAGEASASVRADLADSFLQWFGITGVFLAMVVVIAPPIAFYQIAEMVSIDGTPAAWKIFEDYPLLIAAILLSALLSVAAGHGQASETRRRVGTMIRTAGFPVAAVLAFYGCIHIAAIAATTAVPAFVSATLAGTEALIWTAEQQDNGVPPAEIAARLNEQGQAASLTAAEGLATLLPDYRTRLEQWGPRADCTVALSAGIADPAELADMAWPEDLNSYRDPDAPREILDVKYCVKVTCPSAVAGDDRPMNAMYSSHPANKAGWIYALRFHLFYPDEKLNAGGYCNADGTLADRYQG